MTTITAWIGGAVGVGRLGLVLAFVGAVIPAPPALACRTPVYRYAMYNWANAPYLVFYFHRGQPAEEDKEVNALLAGLVTAQPVGANVVFEPLDASQEEQLEKLPKHLTDAWKKHGEGKQAVHLVFTPWGEELFAGRLDKATVAAMVDSPARKRLGELLKEGNAAIWLILTGPEAEENQRVEKVASEVIADAAAGKVPTADDMDDYDAMEQPRAAEPGEAGPPKDPPAAAKQPPKKKLSAATLKISRTDPAETWLVRTLLAVEPDLKKFEKEPLVFAVYGRGRVLAPFVGKGITVENLTDCLVFLAGPCSCQVKDANPGVDLLMRWDWEATAEAMAAKDEQLAAGPYGYREFTPGGPARDPASAPEPKVTGSTAAEPARIAGVDPLLNVEELVKSAVRPPELSIGVRPETAASPESEQPPATEQSFLARQAWKLGIALAAAAVVVVLAGLIMFRR